MMHAVTRRLRALPRKQIAQVLVGEILALAQREGVVATLAAAAPAPFAALAAALARDLGYRLGDVSRRRMLRLLLELLQESGWMREADEGWQWLGRRESQSVPAADRDDQLTFFRQCLAAAPAYLRGGPPAIIFDETHVEAWDRFLGCEEFRACRALLVELLGLANEPAVRLLDLCHGPGWGLEAVLTRFPAIQATALDFTGAFAGVARARVERLAAERGPIQPVAWVGPERWRGFGHRLPFADGAFDAVFFSCGDPYIPQGQRVEVYREVARVLRPDGRLGILTRSQSVRDPSPVAPPWLAALVLAHDFAESVCAGWSGFSTLRENLRVFAEAGFRTPGASPRTVAAFDGSLWVLRKGEAHG